MDITLALRKTFQAGWRPSGILPRMQYERASYLFLFTYSLGHLP